MANRNRYFESNENRGRRGRLDDERGGNEEGRAGSYGYERDDDDERYFGGSSGGGNGRGFSRGMRGGRGYGRGNYGDLGGGYSNTSDQGEYGGGFYSGRADYDEDYEDNRDSERGHASRGGYSTGRGGGYGDPRRGFSNRRRSGGGSLNDYGGGGTYGGYRDRGYARRGGYGSERENYEGYRGGEGGSDDEERGWLERAGDEVASWFGYGEEDDRRRGGHHRGRGPRNYTRSDERIRDDINDRLTDDYYLDASDIEVEVSNGEVVLTGTVDSRRAKRRAEDIAEEVSGVRNVENRIRVNREGGSSYNYSRSGASNLAPGGSTGPSGMSGSTGTSGTTGTTGTTGMTGAADTTTGSTGTTGAGTGETETAGSTETGGRAGRSRGKTA
ncbi:MAG TPA: BON domain-containing protein [Pyrinomonadaceae bacterium]|jgi:osmotically-inducible protein OsmY